MKWKWMLGLALGAPLSVASAQENAPGNISAQPQTISHAFRLKTEAQVKSVHLAGTFNGWSTTATPMARGEDGEWTIVLPLALGRHEYKFVLDNSRWITDPKVPATPANADGNVNSLLLLLPPDYARPASSSDGETAQSALAHPREVPFLNYDRGHLFLSLRARAGDVSQVRLRTGNRVYTTQITRSDELYAIHTARVPWDRKGDMAYLFEMRDGNAPKYLGASGLSPSTSTRPFVLSAKGFVPFEVPSWVEKSVFYQVFPDRFENGDARNDPRDVVAWNARPEYFNRFGGDIAGVRAHLNHFSDLGIGAVYFNPVFLSPSNHRYDATDFKRIDSQFGTNEEFGSLTRELQKRGIRTVMDFVFNHSARDFAPFADLKERGAASAFKDWYFVQSFPIRSNDGEKPSYTGWAGYPSMPKLNVLNPPTRDYLLGLVDFWHRNAALSGLRLDVAGEVEPAFWKALRQRVKSVNPQSWIVGEVWGDGARWLGGDQWDSVMNYQFRDAALKYFAQGQTKPSQLVEHLMRVHNSYAPQVSRNMMNLLSSHDTPRFLHECKEDERLQRLAATLQFTWVGAPSIYYGEEIAMRGAMDPDNRRGMEWSRANAQNTMLQFYKRLIHTRNQSRALQSGEPQVLGVDDAANTFAFARVLDNDVAIVAMNRSQSIQTLNFKLPASIKNPKGWVDVLSGSRVEAGQTLQWKLEPMSSVILLPAK